MHKILTAFLGVFLLLIFAAAPAIAGQGKDEIEPNDTIDVADSIDDLVIRGHMDEADGDDYFKLTGQEGYEARFTVYHSEGVEVDFEVLSVSYEDSTDYEVVGTATGYGEETITCKIPEQCYIHVWYWSGDGDYEIEVMPTDGGTVPFNWEDFADEDYDEIEPNDEVGLADVIEDFYIYGYMDEEDTDWYELDGQEGLNPTFTIYFDDSGDLEMDFEIWSDDTLIDTASDWGSGESITCEVPGTCYIRVYYWEGTGDYVIEITP